MANNQKVSFDDINLLKSFFSEGKFSSLSNKIKNLKEKMILLNDNARKAEKEHLLKLEAEEKEKARIVESIPSFTAPKEPNKEEIYGVKYGQ